MKKASQDLVHEHKAIIVILDVLEKICVLMKNSLEVNPKDLEQIIHFIRIFADRCHHGKEEGFLFPALEEAGIPRQNGPIGVMLHEHERGRELVRQMEASWTGGTLQADLFIGHATAYITLLRNHIEKENKILFPMGDARLTEAKQKELLEKFDAFEEEVIGKGRHEELHGMLRQLENTYLS